MLTLAAVSNPEPLFTVIASADGRPDLWPRALAGVLSQTVRDVEVLVVGASPDRRALAADPRVRVVAPEPGDAPTLVTTSAPVDARQARHTGTAGAAVNAGAAVARGRYLTMLGAADQWVPHRLELALAGLARAPIAICWSRFPDEVPRARRLLGGDGRRDRFGRGSPPVAVAAFDRDRFAPFDAAVPARADVGWWPRLIGRGAVATVPEVGVLVQRPAGR